MTFLTRRTTSMLALAVLLGPPAIVVSQEHIGTSCADCSTSSAEFSIENHTGVPVHYQVKWGKDTDWKRIVLNSGEIMTHSHPLDANSKAPAPYIRFDTVAGDAAFTAKVYHLDFHAVSSGGYGPMTNTKTAKRYVFEYSADGTRLDLLAR